MATLNLNEKKIPSAENLRLLSSLILSLSSKQGAIENKLINNWVASTAYIKDESFVIYDELLYVCKISNADDTFDKNKWTCLSPTISELTKSDIEALINLSPEEISKLSDLISTEIRLDKTFSSSDTYTRIQAAIDTAKEYTNNQLGKAVKPAYKVVASTSEVTETGYFYLISNGTNYDMYVLSADGSAVSLGTSDVDLSDYYTKTEVDNDFLKKTDATSTYATITIVDDKADKSEIPTTLPANGGNANTVNNHTVKSDVPENAVFTDTVYDDTEVKGSIEELSSNLGEKVDYKVVVEDGTRYVEDIVTQDINTWLPNDNSSILINLKKANGANYSNFQLLCNKQDSKNWTCIVIGGISTFWRICYVNGVRYIEEIATMDKVAKYPDWSNQQTISQTEITVDQDVYIELNQLSSSPIDDLKINGKDVSVSDFDNGLYSTRFSGYVKKGSFVSHPYLTNTNIVRVFPLV